MGTRALATAAWIWALEAELGAEEATDAEEEGAPVPAREVRLEGRAECDDDDDGDDVGAVDDGDDGGDEKATVQFDDPCPDAPHVKQRPSEEDSRS